ncbi:hypothetical protein Xekk_00709 [Xenorhabdus sp. KK7.4]|nr:hypothetical protein Xekk_00709 [Xenorhabdus sp. KK7.4]
MSTDIDITNRLININWINTINKLNTFDYSHLNKLLTENVYDSLVVAYSKKELLRTHTHPEKNNSSNGEYKYFNYSLPNLVSESHNISHSKI